MSLRRYRLFSTISASANAADTFTAQRSGTLKMVQFGVLFDSITDNAVLRVQVSKAAVSDFSATGGAVSQSVAQFVQQGNFVTSGLAQPCGNLIVDCNDRIRTGEALYINAVASGTLSCNCDILLTIEESDS